MFKKITSDSQKDAGSQVTKDRAMEQNAEERKTAVKNQWKSDNYRAVTKNKQFAEIANKEIREFEARDNAERQARNQKVNPGEFHIRKHIYLALKSKVERCFALGGSNKVQETLRHILADITDYRDAPTLAELAAACGTTKSTMRQRLNKSRKDEENNRNMVAYPKQDDDGRWVYFNMDKTDYRIVKKNKIHRRNCEDKIDAHNETILAKSKVQRERITEAEAAQVDTTYAEAIQILKRKKIAGVS